MNLPNRLTCYRILLAVVFMFLLFSPGLLMKSFAIGAFLLASLTDYWDGRIARQTNQITRFGKLMDPVADKILTLSAFMAFVEMKIIPAWMVVVIIARDLLITGLRFLMPAEGVSQAAHASGKHKTVLGFLAILAILVFIALKETAFWKAVWTPPALVFIYWGMLVVVAVTLSSGVLYLIRNKDIFSKS